VAPKVAGSSPVSHPLTQVCTHWISVFCTRLPYASRHFGEQRVQAMLHCYSVLLREARRTSR
jgi:hypothetical protein